MQVKDFETCFSILLEKRVYDSKAKRDLLGIWRLLIEEKACESVVIEDRNLPASRRQVVFGLSYFLTDSFFQQAKTSLPPFVALRMVEKWRRGTRAFLLKKEIDKANRGGGLNLFIPHYGWDTKQLSPKDVFKARGLLQECFMTYHGGYQIKELMHEAHGPEIKDRVITSGEKLRRDYQEFLGSSYLKEVPEKERPYLTGCTSTEAMEQSGSFMALFFSRMSSSRFGFNPGERKILERALIGETDEQMALPLRVSHWTVKKRWQGVYDKVMAADPELLADSPVQKGAVRVKQKRRYLLDYLRHHPEELKTASPIQGIKD